MKKYRTPNGQVVDESVLRQKYGDKFDGLVSNGTFSEHTENDVAVADNTSSQFVTPNGKIVSGDELSQKYGNRFNDLVNNGTFKKKVGSSGTSTPAGVNTGSTGSAPSSYPLASDLAPKSDGATYENLDPVEKKVFAQNSTIPYTPNAPQNKPIVDAIVKARENPVVKYNNAKTFLSDDIDRTHFDQSQNPSGVDIFKTVSPDKLKMDVTGDGTPDPLVPDDKIPSIDYANLRKNQIENQVRDLQNRQYKDVYTGGGGGFTMGTSSTSRVKADNYDELQKQIDNLQSYKEKLVDYTDPIAKVQVDKTVRALPEDKKANVYMKIGMQYNALHDPIEVQNKKNNLETGVDNTRNRELVAIENYGYEAQGLNIAADAAKILQATGKISQDEYDARIGDVIKNQSSLDAKYPAVRLQRIKGALGQIIDRNRDNPQSTPEERALKGVTTSTLGGVSDIRSLWDNVISGAPSEKEIKDAVDELNSKGANITEEEAKYFINNSPDIGNTALIGRTLGGVANLANKVGYELQFDSHNAYESAQYEIGKRFGNTPEKSTEQPQTIIGTDKGENFLKPIENPKAGLHNWGWGTVNMVADGVGTLAKLYLLTEATGGVADAVLGDVAGTEAVAYSADANLGKIVAKTALSEGQKQTFGTIAGMYIDSYPDFLEASKKFIGEKEGGETARQLYANTMGLLNGVAWTILPADKIVHDIIDKSAAVAAKNFAELIPKEGLQAIKQNNIKDFIVNTLTETAKAQGKMESISAITQIADYTAQSLFNKQSVESRNLGQEVVDGALQGLSFLPITLLEGRGLAGKIDKINTLQREAIFRVSDDIPAFKVFADKQVADGKMTEVERDKKVQLLNTAAQIKSIVPDELTKPEKTEYGSNLLFVAKLNAEKELIKGDDAQEGRIDKKIPELKKVNQEILDNTTGVIPADANLPKSKPLPVVGANEISQPIDLTTETTSDPLKDKAATAEALAGLPDNHLLSIGEHITPTGSTDQEKIDFVKNNPKTIAQDYHFAKADNSNPEFVKAVEDAVAPDVNKNQTSFVGKQTDVLVKDRNFFTEEQEKQYHSLIADGKQEEADKMVADRKVELKTAAPQQADTAVVENKGLLTKEERAKIKTLDNDKKEAIGELTAQPDFKDNESLHQKVRDIINEGEPKASKTGDVKNDSTTYTKDNVKDIKESDGKSLLGSVKSVVEAISHLVKGAKVIVHNTNESFVKAWHDAGNKGSAGDGFFSNKNEIHIDATTAKARTAFHEGSHVIFEHVLRNSEEATNRFYDQIKKILTRPHEVTKKPVKTEALKQLEEFESRYKEKDGYTEANRRDEFVTEFFAQVADGRINLEKLPRTTFEKIKDLIRRTAASFGLDPAKIGLDTKEDVVAFAKDVSDAFHKGKKLKAAKDTAGKDAVKVSKTEVKDKVNSGVGGDVKVKRYVNFSDLSDSEKADIADQIYNSSDYLKKEYNPNTFKEYLDGEVGFKIPVVELDAKAANKKVYANSGISEKNLEKVRGFKDLHPVISNNGEFYDGGHRIKIANERGNKTIDAYEISHLLNWDWKGFDNNKAIPEYKSPTQEVKDNTQVEKDKPFISKEEKNSPVGIAFAPYREKNVNTDAEDKVIRDSPEYKLHQQNLKEIADGLGIKILDNADTWGGYVDGETGRPVQEVSNVIHVDATPEQAELLAALLGKSAPEMQDSVLMGHYSDEGLGLEHTVSTGSFENAKKSLAYLKENSLQYFTLDKKSGDVIILDTDRSSTENIINFAKQISNEYGIKDNHSANEVNAKFIEQRSYDEIIKSGRGQDNSQNGFDINAYLQKAKASYDEIKSSNTPTSELNTVDNSSITKASKLPEEEKVKHSSELRKSINNKTSIDYEVKVQQVFDRALPLGERIPFGLPPESLLSIKGVQDVPMYMNAGQLNTKISQFNHDFTPQETKQIFKAIQEPIAIFHSEKSGGAKIILTDVIKEGRNVVVPIYPSDNYNTVESIHGRKYGQLVGEWFNSEKNVEWVDKEKALKFIQTGQGNNTLEAGKLRAAIKVVKEFENPKLSEVHQKAEPVKYTPPTRFTRALDIKSGTNKPKPSLLPSGKEAKTGSELQAYAKGLKENADFTDEEVVDHLKELGYTSAQAERALSDKPYVKVVAPKTKSTGTPPPNDNAGGEIVGSGEGTGITHADTEQLRKDLGLNPYEKIPKTQEQWIEAAKERIKNGELPALIKKMERGENISEVEQKMMGLHIANLNDVLEKNPTAENLSNLNRAVELSDYIGGTQAATSLVARKGTFLADDSLGASMIAEKESLGIEELPQEIMDEVAKEHLEIKDLRHKFQEGYDKGFADALKKQAEEKVKAARKYGRKNRSHEEFVKERQSFREELKAAKEKHDKWLKEQGIYTQGVGGFVLTGDMAKAIGKIWKSHAEETILKFDDLVHRVYGDVKDLLPAGATKKDIIDVMAGVYTEKKVPSLDEFAAQRRNLQQEARLLKKIEDVRLGKTTDSFQNKIEKSRRVTELEVQLKELRKRNNDNTPVEKTDGERLAARRRAIISKIAQIDADIKAGKFEKKETLPPVILDKKTQALQDRLIEREAQQAVRRQKNDYQKTSKWSKAADLFWQVTGLRRLVNAAVDFSIPFRQADPITKNPFKYIPRFENGKFVKNTAVKAWQNMFRLSFAPKEFKRFQYNLEKNETGRLFIHFGGVFSNPTEVKMEKREEEFSNSILHTLRNKIEDGSSEALKKAAALADKAWFSERAAAGFLNTARIEEYTKGIKNLQRKGLTPENSPEAYKSLAKWVMNITGRGNLLKALEDSHAGRVVANRTYFGARLMAAKLNILNPATYVKMPKEVRVQAFKDMAGYTSGVLLVAAAGLAAGGSVSLNQDDPDFLQLRFGDTVYDISGGAAGYIRTYLRIVRGVAKQLKAPRSKEANSYSRFMASSVWKTMVANKLSPNTAYAYHFLTGKSATYDDKGHIKPFDPTEVLKIYPLYVDGVVQAYQQGGVLDGLSVFVPEMFGVGVQQYKAKEKK